MCCALYKLCSPTAHSKQHTHATPPHTLLTHHTGIAVTSADYTPTPTTTPTPAPAPAPAPLTSTSDSSSNVGMIVGIAVGVVVAVILVAAVAGWLVYRVKRKQRGEKSGGGFKTHTVCVGVCVVVLYMQYRHTRTWYSHVHSIYYVLNI